MNLNLLAFAVPFFLVFIFIEYWVSRRQGKDYFSFAQSISNLSIGIAERLSDVFVAGIFYFIYDYLHTNYAIWKIESSWYHWILLLLVTDFVWYWYHRLGHEVNLFWAAHVVHHQSPEFNYTASARVTVFQAVLRFSFWSVLPIIGFSAGMITTILLVHGLYPFFTHTQTIGKLGWLEYIFVTPSHHRVHHASNDQYLDKNYGDVFIFWDKIFGTFVEEKEQPVFGLNKPLNSYSFLWQHFHFTLELYYAIRQKKGFGDKVRILFGKPDLIDSRIREMLERKFRIFKTPQTASIPLNRYVLVQMVAMLFLLFAFILFEQFIALQIKVIFSGIMLSTLINCGAILERRAWIFHVEWIRFLLLVVLLLCISLPAAGSFLILTAVAISILQYNTLQQRYLRLVYRRV
jgi:sterol desaturase/sphingolipid hydroxylase (fatty acid hydroxylase superfamily)